MPSRPPSSVASSCGDASLGRASWKQSSKRPATLGVGSSPSPPPHLNRPPRLGARRSEMKAVDYDILAKAPQQQSCVRSVRAFHLIEVFACQPAEHCILFESSQAWLAVAHKLCDGTAFGI